MRAFLVLFEGENMRKFISTLLMGLAIIAGLTTLTASPASATTCPTPECGGVVRNVTSASVWVSNCWQDGGETREGASPPCATNGASQNRVNAIWFLGQNQVSTDLGRFYYDVDAVQMVAGCRTSFQTLAGLRVYDRRGLSSLWVKISSEEKGAVVTRVVC